jgi:hypothetical protein
VAKNNQIINNINGVRSLGLVYRQLLGPTEVKNVNSVSTPAGFTDTTLSQVDASETEARGCTRWTCVPNGRNASL